MLDIDDWMKALLDALRTEFCTRLLFVGLQGSYRRGEAGPTSDIDAVVILDEVTLADLQAYRRLLAALPASELACGFISGTQELLHWPRHELFQFQRDTRPLYGDLAALLPPISRGDIEAGVQTGAAGLYHTCSHSLVHDPENLEILKGAFKGAYFVLLARHYLLSGNYCQSKAELLDALAGTERQILATSMHWDECQGHIAAHPDTHWNLLLSWCQGILRQTG